MSRSRRTLVIAGVALVAALGLTACEDQPGSAAYVGDDHISVQRVQDDTAEVIAAASGVTQTPLDASEVNRRQVNRLVTERLILTEAERLDISVSDSEVDALLAQAIGNAPRERFEAELAAGTLVPPSQVFEFARIVALNQKLIAQIAPGADEDAGSAAIVKRLGELSEELGTGVSPRFGTWDPADLSVTLPPNDLSTPAPSADPTPEILTGDVAEN